MTDNQQDVDGKVVVVTGAASGIGFGIANVFASVGATVVVSDIDAHGAEDAAARIDTPNTLAVRCDVTDRADVEALADAAWNAFGRVDIMVNNAGVFPSKMASLIDSSIDEARWLVEVNLFGTWHGIAVFARRFIDQGAPAHIVNVGSENSVGVPHTGAGFYTATKHAVLALSDVLRRELPDFVKVSIVCPGAVPTQLSTSARNRPEQFGGPLIEHSPRAPGTYGMPADEIGKRVVAGVASGTFYIFTHPPVRDIVDERHQEMIAAFEAHAPRFAGDGHLDTRAILGRGRSARA